MYRSTAACSLSGVPRQNRAGITLIEVLVSLMLLSLLAAAVFPVVTQRVARGEPLRAAHELSSIGAGIEAFAADLPGTYPADLEDLATPISTADGAIRGSSGPAYFSDSDVSRWRGPYLEAALADGGAVMTGFGVPIRDDFIRFDASNDAPAGSDGFQSDGPGLFLALQIGSAGRQLTASQFEAINDLIDGPGEPNGPGANTSWTLGRLRFDNSLVPADSVGYYLAMPIER